MKIVAVEDMHAAGGIRASLSFLKLTTDEGIVGWSEFNEEMQGPRLAVFPAVTMAIRRIAERVVGLDPRDAASINAAIYATTRLAAGGVVAQATGAIVNACMDVKAKALGVPVYELMLGGAHRRRIPVYWSHFGSTRVRHAEKIDKPPIRTLDDLAALARAAAGDGFRALKTNLLLWDGETPESYRVPLLGEGPGHPEQNLTPRLLRGILDTLGAMREGAGPDVGLIIDLGHAFKPEALRRIARAVERFHLTWLEADLYQPEALARLRWSTSTPIGSGEAVMGARAFKTYLAAQAMDVAIIDVQYNGLVEAMKMAAIADAYDVNVAAHNAYGHLSTLMGAHMCAAAPNVQLMEYDVDHGPWTVDLVTHPCLVENGELVVPDRPGWGTDIDEEAVLAHPPPEVGGAEWLLDYHRRAGVPV